VEKFKQSIDDLGHALSFINRIEEDSFYFSGIVKSFEVCFEYSWKYFKQKINNEGIDVYSPREAIKQAGRIGIINDVEKWLGFLEDRNISVHDYLGMPPNEYLKTIQAFYIEVQKIAL